MTTPTMSQFATRLDCLEARDKYHIVKIEQLERQNQELREALREILDIDDVQNQACWIASSALSAADVKEK